MDSPHTAFNHEPSAFVVRGLGLDSSDQNTPSPGIDGPVEYIFKLGVSPSIKDENGVLVPTGTESPAFISFAGPRGHTSMIPIKSSLKAGTVGEFSAIAQDVGPIKSIKLAEPFSHKSTWRPTTVEVNRISPAVGNVIPSRPDGWVKFEVNRVVKEPVSIIARGTGSVTRSDAL